MLKIEGSCCQRLQQTHWLVSMIYCWLSVCGADAGLLLVTAGLNEWKRQLGVG